MRRRKALLAACVAVALAAAGAAAASAVSVLVLDVADHRATLVVKRSSVPGLRLLDTAESLCRRQGPGSPLHSIYLGPAFCPLALAHGDALKRENVYLQLPFSGGLHALAGD